MKSIAYTLIALILLAGVVVAGTVSYGWHLFTAPGPLANETVFVLEKGTGLRKLAGQLEQNNIINNDLAFIFGVTVEDNSGRLQAGEYDIPAAVTGEALMALFVSGKVVMHRLTIPEGLQSREIRALVAAAEGLEGEITQPMPEGAFLPETYYYHLGDSRDDLVERMADSMTAATTELMQGNNSVPEIKTAEELVTLASIIEKETGLAAERPHVAGVFLNRLRKGMKLQSDPTVTYGITEGKRDLDRPLSRKDLATATAYNTYQISGLPKGPIANPGLDSLKAVLAPEKTDNLYFVADGSGGHAFSATLDEHNKNVRKWRKLQKK